MSRFGVDARDARSALAQARGCGMPEGRPIYFALDTDPRPLSASQWKGVFAYLDGAAAVLGRDSLPLGSGKVDYNRAMTDDFGQWRVGDDMPLNDADKKWLAKEIRDAVNDHADLLFRWADHGGGPNPDHSPPNHPNNHKAILDRLDELEKRLPS